MSRNQRFALRMIAVAREKCLVPSWAPRDQESMEVYGGDAFNCLYRSPTGERCAIGVLIPDEKYDPGIEHMPASIIPRSIIEVDGAPLSAEDAGFDEFLRALQECHDHALRGARVGGAWLVQEEGWRERFLFLLDGLEARVRAVPTVFFDEETCL